MSEQFSWSKFFVGIVDPTAYFKTLANIIRIALVVLVCFAVYVLCMKIHSTVAPKKPQAATFNVNDQIGGNVKNSADQKENKFGILNF